MLLRARWVLVVLTLFMAPSAAIDARQRTPSVKDVMQRVADYVGDYGERAAIVVASERYTQQTRANNGSAPQKRLILADVAIVRVETISGWIGFRDVIEVDGASQTDREDRLINLLRAGGDYTEARRLSDEGARFNIGVFQRNYNVPTSALFFFTRDNLDRFKFTARSVEKDGTWRIAFRETARPTLIRTPSGQPVPSEGELWVNPNTGAVLRTVLRTEVRAANAKRQVGSGRVEVSYRFVDTMDMWLPAAMDEEFEASADKNTWETLEGHAEYSNYRKFTTSGRVKGIK